MTKFFKKIFSTLFKRGNKFECPPTIIKVALQGDAFATLKIVIRSGTTVDRVFTVDIAETVGVFSNVKYQWSIYSVIKHSMSRVDPVKELAVVSDSLNGGFRLIIHWSELGFTADVFKLETTKLVVD